MNAIKNTKKTTLIMEGLISKRWYNDKK